MKLFPILQIQTLLFILAGFTAPLELFSQSYNTSIGLRWGDGIGITARQRVLKKASIEGIFYQHHKSNQTIGGLVLAHHMPVITRRLNLYAGAGYGWIFPESSEIVSVPYNALMVNAGLEFTISRLNLSWDFMPVIPVSSGEQQMTALTAFSLRYVLLKKSKQGLFNKSKKKQNKKKHSRRKH